jgi:diaminohydroxyphosphoribosylaminopyrimidine deaminase/5-amino-6-(5-phosphoribosylamino)uracil reductase
VHEQRAAADAIAVGTGTVLDDNPSLTARTEGGGLHERQPVPVIFGERAIEPNATIYSHPETPIVLGHRDIARGLATLHERNIRSLYVEGGPTLASAFIAAGVVDRFYIFVSPLVLGGPRLAVGDLGISTLADRIDIDIQSVTHIGRDLLIEATPRKDA